MRGRTPTRRLGAVRAGLLAAAMLVATAAAAKTTGVSDDASVQSGPCYDALVDKNAATPTTAPNRELGAACEAEHGDIDKAWARVVRLWGSDGADLPDYDSYRPADSPVGGGAPPWLAWVGLLLAYAVLGTPMRAAARLTGAPPARASGTIGDVVVCLGLRALILTVFVALLGIPSLGAVCGIALILWLMLGRFIGPPPPRVSPTAEGAAGALATHVASALNDGIGAAAGLAAIALLAQRGVLVPAIGLALALPASLGPVIAARRALRATRLGAAAAAALLAAILGEVVILTPPVAAVAGGLTGANLVVPLLLAVATLAAGWRARTIEERGGQLGGR